MSQPALWRVWIEPHHEKNLFMPYVDNKGADQPAHRRSLIIAFVVCCLDSIIPLNFFIQNFKPLWLRRSVRVAERLALPPSDHGIVGSNPAGGEILPEPKRRFIAQSLSIVSKWLKYCWRDVKPYLIHPSVAAQAGLSVWQGWGVFSWRGSIESQGLNVNHLIFDVLWLKNYYSQKLKFMLMKFYICRYFAWNLNLLMVKFPYISKNKVLTNNRQFTVLKGV